MKLKRGLRGCNSAQLAFQRAVAPTGQRLGGGRLERSEPYLRGERRIYGPVIEPVHAAERLSAAALAAAKRGITGDRNRISQLRGHADKVRRRLPAGSRKSGDGLSAARLYGGQRPGARVGQSERGFPFRQQFNGAGDTNVPEQPVCARMAACIEARKYFQQPRLRGVGFTRPDAPAR